MFDSETVPKYIIGKDYKVTPVSPSTTDVIMNGCSLAAEGISQ
jgi:predicted CoA-binding protein